jgi:hypothetical protein
MAVSDGPVKHLSLNFVAEVWDLGRRFRIFNVIAEYKR